MLDIVSTIIIVLLFIIILVGLYSYHKVTSAISSLRHRNGEDIDNLFRQTEALLGIYAELRLEHVLPKTRGWAASPDFLCELIRFARSARPAATVECGSGASTVVLARCAQLNGIGHVFSLESDPHFANKTRNMLLSQGLENFATVIDAPLVKTIYPEWSGVWYDISSLPKGMAIDMLVVDGPPHTTCRLARYPVLPALIDQCNDSCMIFLDDADRNDEAQIISSWMGRFENMEKIDSYACEKGCVGLRLNQAVK